MIPHAKGSEAAPGLAPPEPSPISAQALEVDGERFVVSERRPSEDRHEYGYEWLTGPNPGYGFGSSGPEKSLAEHEVDVRRFLADIDPESGYLSEQSGPPAQ